MLIFWCPNDPDRPSTALRKNQHSADMRLDNRVPSTTADFVADADIVPELYQISDLAIKGNDKRI